MTRCCEESTHSYLSRGLFLELTDASCLDNWNLSLSTTVVVVAVPFGSLPDPLSIDGGFPTIIISWIILVKYLKNQL